MITSLPLEKMLDAALRHGGDYAEVFAERTQAHTVAVDNEHLENVSQTTDVGIGIRVLTNTQTAYGSTNDITDSSLIELANAVGQAAGQREANPKPIRLTRGKPPPATVRRHPSSVSLKEKMGIVWRADDVARKAGQPIRQVRTLFSDRVRRIWIVSSDGRYVSDEQVETLLRVQTVAADGDRLQSAYEQIGGTQGFEIFETTPPEEVAERAARRAVMMLKAAPAPAGPMPVVMAAEAGGTMIHEAVGHGLEADLANQGMSVYAGLIGETVAAPKVTVLDDASLAGGRGSFSIDDEGEPASRTVLIEGGILRGYLYDRVTASKEGAASTGNGRRQSYEHPPVVRMTNTLITPASDDPAEILRSTDRGLYVKRMGGGQVNTLNGDFVFDVQEGYRIEGGRIGEPVRGATLTGNGPKVLKIIDRVGNDLGFSIGTCGKLGQGAPVSCGQPTIRIPELVVGGTA